MVIPRSPPMLLQGRATRSVSGWRAERSAFSQSQLQSESREQVSQLRRFGQQVISRGMRSARLARHPLDHLYAVRFELANLVWIIREQANAVQSKSAQRSGGKTVIAGIGGESQVLIGFHRVHAAILQLIGAQFVH